MTASIATMGEIMLRLKPPGRERFFQSPWLEATFGGGEVNGAVSLSQFGLDATFISALPDNPIGEACFEYLRGKGVDTGHIVRGGDRMGVYYLEVGANQRPSNVIYDRSGSSMATLGARLIRSGSSIGRQRLVSHYWHHASFEPDRVGAVEGGGCYGQEVGADRVL